MPTPNDDRQYGECRFTVPLAEIKLDASGDPDTKGSWTMRGHAAVFNRKSHDLGGFRTVIAPGAFTKVLDTNPDVHMLWDHDTRYVLGRTKNKTLEMREDPYGLHAWARVAPTSYGNDLRISMERGDIDQMSFACDIGSSEWAEDTEGNITRTIHEVDALYDVTICAQGAFPQTDAQLVASFRNARAELASAIEAGHVIRRDIPDLVAAHGPGGEGHGIAQPGAEGAADVADSDERMTELQNWAKTRYLQAHTAR